MAALAADDALAALKATKKFVKTTGELVASDPGYATATKTERRAKARALEARVRERWAAERTFESGDPRPRKPGGGKFMCTFPYPYMNGRLHLGHAFSLTKADFAAGYHRLKGDAVLFPFSFHCTGMPIQAAANKLRREIETYGLDQCLAGNFEMAAEEEARKREEARARAAAAEAAGETKLPSKKAFKGSKTKAVAKDGGKKKKTQWEILQMCDVPDEEIEQFTDAQHWLRYFPPHCMADLKAFGLHADWRRSFITTDTNPYYDSFIRWQFRKLKAAGRIAFGKRPTVYSIRDGQACMDHDRASGEGKGPQEYTLIKMRLHDDGLATLVDRVPDLAPVQGDGASVFLVAATLRPETMYGQTNCFVLPSGDYGAYRLASGEIFVMSEHAARNMAHQAQENTMAVWGKTDKVADVSGRALLGLPLKAPNAKYERVFTLPLLTISMTKGTGIVTSVPSDAPDDYAALRDMQTNAELREEYGISLEMVEGYDPIPIIRIPGGDVEVLGLEDFGDMAAVTACKHLGVKDQHDKGKLAKIKKSVYNKGFYFGVMTVGSQKGKGVEDAKDAVKNELIDAGMAARYWEPEEEIMSRSGDKCVIAFIDQWYLKYGTPDWRDPVLEHVREKGGAATSGGGGGGEGKSSGGGDDQETFKAYGVRVEYENTLNWLGNWACSRSFGLGTRVPWDEQFVVESLSDSTIYMAYYTVSHLLQGEGNVDGGATGPLGISAAQMNDAVWDYIFKKAAYPEGCGIDEAKLKQCRDEFEFWYPMDLRVSGKDLVRNHLTMCLYNHAAIWDDEPEKWPRSFFTNGHVMVDNQKMSKSSGNFISLINAIQGDNVHLHVPVVRKKVKYEVVDPNTGKKKKKNRVVEEQNWADAKWRSQGWTADTVRFSLAEAGDTMSDANFQTDVANNMILELDNQLAWIKEMCASTELRTGELSTHDKVLHLRLDECIREADEFYKTMKFSLAIKWAFHEIAIRKKKYREYHAKSDIPMHKDCVMRIIRVLVVMMSPVITHWSEHIWRDVLGEPASVTYADWPELRDGDKAPLRVVQYVDDMLKDFRDRRNKAKKKKSKKKKKGGAAADPAPVGPPTKGTIFVQKKDPAWKCAVKDFLSGHFDAATKSFDASKKDLISGVMKLAATNEEIKAQGKRLSGIVAWIIGAAEKDGADALQPRFAIDETTVLQEFQKFVAAELQLADGVTIADADAHPDEAKAAEAQPGAPSLLESA